MVDTTVALPKGKCEKQMRTGKVIAKKTGSPFNPVHASDNKSYYKVQRYLTYPHEYIRSHL